MSIFTDIGKWFEKVFSSAPSWQKAASATLTVVAPLLETVITLTVGEPAAAVIGDVIGQVQSDMAAAANLITSSGATPTLAGVLTAIKTNLSSLLTAGQIKDSNTLSKVTSVVNTIIGEIEAIAKVVPAAA